MLGFFLAFVESDRAVFNSLLKASRVLHSLGINRFPSEKGPEVRRIGCMMIYLSLYIGRL